MSKRTRNGKSTKGQSSRYKEPTMEDKIQEFGVFDSDVHQGNYFDVSRRPIHPGDVIDWDFIATHDLARELFESINTDAFTRPQWANLFQINEPVYRELVWEFFTSFEFDSTPCSAKSGLNRGETVRAELMTMGFWPNIGDGDFVMGETTVKKVRDPKVRIAVSFGLLTDVMRDALSVEHRAHIFKKKYLIAMNVLMNLGRGSYCWPATRAVGENDEV
ncbi:hypothetical protein Tco_0876712 [Tanacetum coccineum]|uniref:Uncharacterized protein n=1 Tax=Tanacetum coccineum TaxID=301880 RepID=A0ABQ5BT15_9ASTR